MRRVRRVTGPYGFRQRKRELSSWLEKVRAEPEIIPIIRHRHNLPTIIMTCDQYKHEVSEKLMKMVDRLGPKGRQHVYETADIQGAQWIKE